MSRFYRVQIDDIFLTSTGDEDGIPCMIELNNLEEISRQWIGTSYPTSSGHEKEQWVENTDVKFEIKVINSTTEVYRVLRDFAEECAALSAANQEDPAATFIINITEEGSEEETTSLYAKWNPDNPVRRESFWTGGMSKNIDLRLIKKGLVIEED